MKTKIVYILTFNDSNYYFEQALLSACSCRKHNPDAEIIILMDKDSASLVTGWREIIYDYINQVVPIDIPTGFNAMQASRWLKTNLRNLIDGDFLFIDTDTIICRSLDEIENHDYEIGMVYDNHVSLKETLRIKFIKECFARAEYPLDLDAEYWNSGVMYVRDTEKTRQLFKDWNRLWFEGCKKGVNPDQISLHEANRINGQIIKQLDGEWNCQVEGRFINYLHGAYLLHYFSSTTDDNPGIYYFKKQSVYKCIRDKQMIDAEIMSALNDSYRQFLPNFEILSSNILLFYKRMEPIGELLSHNPRRYKIVEWITYLLKRF